MTHQFLLPAVNYSYCVLGSSDELPEPRAVVLGTVGACRQPWQMVGAGEQWAESWRVDSDSSQRSSDSCQQGAAEAF